MDAAHSANPTTISMNEHDVPFVNLSIAVFQQDFDSTAHPASFPGNPFHWALALEELNTWTAISRLSMRNVVDCGSNRGSSSSDEETDISFKPPPSPSPPFLSSSSPSPLSSSSPSPSPPPRSGGDVSPRLGTAPVNLYYILNTGGIEWETSCRTGLSLDSIPSYLGSVDVARIRGVDLKDLDEFLMQFTAENPRPGAKWNAAIWAMNCLEDLHLSELIELPTFDQDTLYRRIMTRINSAQNPKKGPRHGHFSSGSPTTLSTKRMNTFRVSL